MLVIAPSIFFVLILSCFLIRPTWHKNLPVFLVLGTVALTISQLLIIWPFYSQIQLLFNDDLQSLPSYVIPILLLCPFIVVVINIYFYLKTKSELLKTEKIKNSTLVTLIGLHTIIGILSVASVSIAILKPIYDLVNVV